MVTVVGVDPGARWVGIVARDGDKLLHHELLDREGTSAVTEVAEWVEVVLEAVYGVAEMVGYPYIAVEAATPPIPHLGLTNPAGIIDTAVVAGAILGRFDALWVPAAGHGNPVPPGTPPKVGRRILEASYPAELIGARETTGRGRKPLQHLRAAWDVSGAARALL